MVVFLNRFKLLEEKMKNYFCLLSLVIIFFNFAVNEVEAMKYYVFYYFPCESLKCSKCKEEASETSGGRRLKILYAIFDDSGLVTPNICENCYSSEIESTAISIFKEKVPDLNREKLLTLIKDDNFVKQIPMTVFLNKPSIKYCEICKEKVNVLEPHYYCANEHFCHLPCVKKLIEKYPDCKMGDPFLCFRLRDKTVYEHYYQKNLDNKIVKCYFCNGKQFLEKVNHVQSNSVTKEFLKSIVDKITVSRENSTFCTRKTTFCLFCGLILGLILKLKGI